MPSTWRPLIHHLAGVSVVSSPQEDQDLGVRGPGFRGGGEKTCCSSLSPAWPPPQLRPQSASVAAGGLLLLNRERKTGVTDPLRLERPSLHWSSPGVDYCEVRGACPGLGPPPPGWVLRALDPKQNATSAAVWEHFGQEAPDQRLSANKLGNLQ